MDPAGLGRVLVIGPAGSGKSFLVNQIVGREATKHQLSAKPVTLETSGHLMDSGKVEVIDTPGLNGDPAIIAAICKDLQGFDPIHRIIIVLGKKRLEPTNISDIRTVLKVANHAKNPGSFLFLVNDRRDKNDDQTTKEENLRSCLRMLGVDDFKIISPDSEIEEETSTSLAMTVSNHSSGNFSREMTFLKGAFLPSRTGGNILQDFDRQVIMLKLRYLTSESFRYPGISFLIFHSTSNSSLQGLFVKEQNIDVNNAALSLRFLRLLLYQ